MNYMGINHHKQYSQMTIMDERGEVILLHPLDADEFFLQKERKDLPGEESGDHHYSYTPAIIFSEV